MTETMIERRIVTVLFADLVGFTSLSENLDPEDVATIQNAYFTVVRETIGRYRGQLEKFIGDAAMAAFGVPRTFDDDAERAVKAGLALVSAVDQLGARLGLDEGALQLRVGVNSGEVLHVEEGPDRGRVTGDTVNVAARLQTAASPGSVLVGEMTALAVAGSFELGDSVLLELKGKEQRVRAQPILLALSDRSRERAMGGLRAPTLGREGTLRLLEDALEDSRKGALRVLIAAPPGVGKTRVVDEFALRLGASATDSLICRARLRPEVLAPYEAVAQLALATLSLAGATKEGERIQQVTAGRILRARLTDSGIPPARAVVVEQELLSVVWPPKSERSGGRIDDRNALFDAWLAAFDALAGAAGSVWIVEDVHWAAGDLLAFLSHSSRSGSRGGRLVITTARPSLLEREPDWCEGADESVLVHLQPLPPTHAGELVRALIGDALPSKLVEAIVDRSDGNPLFIEELLRTWISVGLLAAKDDGKWRLMASPDEIPLPATVQTIYAAQLDDLSPDTRLVARRAAVVGRRFPLASLEPLGISDWRHGIEALNARALIAGPFLDPLLGETFAYRHALLRDAGYASLARAERARLHVRLARWLEQVAGERWSEVAEVIARHFEAAVETAPSLASTVDGDLQREKAAWLAAEWFERAAQVALRLAAHEAAHAMLERSLDLTAETDVLDRARRLQRLGEITAFTGDMQAGADAVAEAVRLFGELAPTDELAERGYARAAASLAEISIEQLRFVDARSIVEQALETVSVEDEGLARLYILRGHATIVIENDVESATADSERARELSAKLGDPALELDASAWLARMHIPYASALALVDWAHVEARARELGRWATAAAAVECQATEALIEDRAADVRHLTDRMTDMALTYGLSESVGWADYLRAEAGAILGDWDMAIDAGIRALELATRYAYHRVVVRTWMALIPLAASRGRRDIGHQLHRWFEPRRETFPPSPFARLAMQAFDLNLTRLGFDTQPQLEAEVLLPAFGSPWGQPSLFLQRDDVLRYWLTQGDVEPARDALARLEAVHASGASRLARATDMLMRARVLAAEGLVDKAAAEAEHALDEARALSAPWWEVLAIRLLESLDRTTPELIAEARALDAGLGIATSD